MLDKKEILKALEKKTAEFDELDKKYKNLKVSGYDIDRCTVALKFENEYDLRNFIMRNYA